MTGSTLCHSQSITIYKYWQYSIQTKIKTHETFIHKFDVLLNHVPIYMLCTYLLKIFQQIVLYLINLECRCDHDFTGFKANIYTG